MAGDALPYCSSTMKPNEEAKNFLSMHTIGHYGPMLCYTSLYFTEATSQGGTHWNPHVIPAVLSACQHTHQLAPLQTQARGDLLQGPGDVRQLLAGPAMPDKIHSKKFNSHLSVHVHIIRLVKKITSRGHHIFSSCTPVVKHTANLLTLKMTACL
jgi:hypothetical protein